VLRGAVVSAKCGALEATNMGAKNGVGPIARAAVALTMLVSATDAGAGQPDCWGKWHLELARPTAEKEAWLSPGSWCRGATLPRAVDLEVRRSASATPSMTGAPLAPSDVLVGAGTCTFAFSGTESHVPPNFELTVEVTAKDSKVQGSARCAEKTPAAGGGTGVTVSVAVNGSVTGEAAAAPVDTRELVASVTRACARHDADALWGLSTPRFQAVAGERAQQIRAAVPPAELRRLYGFHGKPEAFTGLNFLRHAIESAEPAENPCADAARWKIDETRELPDERTVAVKRPDGTLFGLTFVRGPRGWKLDQLSKSLPPKR